MATFFSGVAYTAMQSVFFIYLQGNKGFDTVQIASAFSLLVFASQAFSLFAGYWGDRFGRSKMMLLGCLMDAIAYILLITTDYYPLLLLTTFFLVLVARCLVQTLVPYYFLPQQIITMIKRRLRVNFTYPKPSLNVCTVTCFTLFTVSTA
ncbi:Major Facilitator Superfamily [Rodentibacter pneumotropicus]|uniref:Major Facilitator Superfamily n=1 Tax=Rodentibacter pneumotropicus TaxID=758 RepID=A0A448MMI7_9PAST|nr:Major Facilitator Superfamily [Rodentibacter pneumotropicus]